MATKAKLQQYSPQKRKHGIAKRRKNKSEHPKKYQGQGR